MNVTCPICSSMKGMSTGLRKKAYELVRCASCGHGWVTPLPSDEELNALYNGQYFSGTSGTSQGYASGYVSAAEAARPMYEQVMQKVESHADEAAPRRLLDVGCAYGSFPAFARTRGWDVQGIELSQDATSFARDIMGLNVFHGTLETYCQQSPTPMLGAVTMLDVLEHLPSPTRALTLAAGLLAPGGVMVVKVPYVDSIRVKIEKDKWRQFKPPEHLHYFSKRSIEQLFAPCGLRIVDLRKEGGIGLKSGKSKEAAGLGAPGSAGEAKAMLRKAVKTASIPIARLFGWMDMLLVTAQKQ